MSTPRPIDSPPRGARVLRRCAQGCAAAATVALLAVSPAAGDLPAVGQKAATRKAPDCSVRKSTTLQANRHVRVFRTTDDFVWGCRRTADRAFRLGDWGECQNSDVVSNVEVAGTYAAWISTTCGLDFSAESIELANLRTGRFAFRSSPILPFAATERTFEGIRRIVVDDRGVVAWTASRSAGAKTIAIEVRRRTRASGGASVVVDSDLAIDTDSLRRKGHRITWRKGGETFSAAL